MRRFLQLLQTQSRKRMAVAGILIAAAAVAISSGDDKEREIAETSTTVADTSMEQVRAELPVGEEEAELLSKLYRAMELQDYTETAIILNENEDAFDALMKSLEGEKYSYFETELEDGTVTCEMEKVTSASVFEGMVLTRYNTAFYGDFSEGMPNGSCYAIQTMVLDHPRYSYAEGTWKNGKLNGEGRCGYRYYLEAPENGFVEIEKRGPYRENLLDGAFVYETESSSGETLSWEMKAVNGVTVLTPQWKHFPFRKEYMLGAVENADRVYVLSEDKVATVLWNNLISW